jgi:hypothetical protein
MKRLDSQFFVASIDPTMRYVQAGVGTGKYRLAPDKSGFDNLILAGDWTRTGLNCGSLEATVMSGKQAARAVSGKPITVWGEDGFKIKARETKAKFWFIAGLVALVTMLLWRGKKK